MWCVNLVRAMPRKNKQRGLTTRSVNGTRDDWNKRSANWEARLKHFPIGSIYRVTHNSRMGNGMDDGYRVEWGVQYKNRGTLVLHGELESVKALMKYMHVTLKPNETLVSKETVREFMLSFCINVLHKQNKTPMWYVNKKIPNVDLPQSQYERAQSFLRSLLIRTLRNIYIRATGEEIV